jgi:hypothetical protein
VLLVIAGNAVGILSAIPAAQAQVQASQTFSIRIPPKITVASPAPAVVLSHSGSGSDQVVAVQRWDVHTNLPGGASVTFSTAQAFTHTTHAAAKRDAQIELMVASADARAGWIVPVASDRTYHRRTVGDEPATVRAVSHGPGKAAFEIVVTCLEDPNEPFEQGEYALTVVGTVTAN